MFNRSKSECGLHCLPFHLQRNFGDDQKIIFTNSSKKRNLSVLSKAPLLGTSNEYLELHFLWRITQNIFNHRKKQVN